MATETETEAPTLPPKPARERAVALPTLPGVKRVAYRSERTWLDARREGVGSSDVPTLFGLTRWRSPYALWADKRNLLPEKEEQAESEYLQWGRLLQAPIVQEYGRRTGRPIAPVHPYTVYVDLAQPFRRVSPDAFAMTPNGGDPMVVEAKNVTGWKRKEWLEEPPLPYLLQVQYQMLVLQIDHGVIAALIDGNSLVWQEVRPHEPTMKKIGQAVVEFWQRVESNTPPPVDGSAATTEVLKALYTTAAVGKTVVLPADATDWHARRLAASEEIERQTAIKQECTNLLMAAIGDAELGLLPAGQGGYSFKSSEVKGYTVAPSVRRTLRYAGKAK